MPCHVSKDDLMFDRIARGIVPCVRSPARPFVECIVLLVISNRIIPS